jgi:hypothetical protein
MGEVEGMGCMQRMGEPSGVKKFSKIFNSEKFRQKFSPEIC